MGHYATGNYPDHPRRVNRRFRRSRYRSRRPARALRCAAVDRHPRPGIAQRLDDSPADAARTAGNRYPGPAWLSPAIRALKKL